MTSTSIITITNNTTSLITTNNNSHSLITTADNNASLIVANDNTAAPHILCYHYCASEQKKDFVNIDKSELWKINDWLFVWGEGVEVSVSIQSSFIIGAILIELINLRLLFFRIFNKKEFFFLFKGSNFSQTLHAKAVYLSEYMNKELL